MFVAVICEKCGARNLPENKVCRRCKMELCKDLSFEEIPLTPILGERWEVLEKLNSKNLFSGLDRQTKQPVLIRQLDQLSARDRSTRSQFLNEAKLIATLESSHFISVLAIIEDAQTPALIMASPEGISLDEFLTQRGPLPVAVSILLFEQLIDAISILHSTGITHRNLNPHNIYIGSSPITGNAYLTITDFALANSMHENEAGADTGTLIGMKLSNAIGIKATPYISPELLVDNYDFRSDIYAAGVLLFKMLTNRVPIAANLTDENTIAELIRTESPTSIRFLRPEISQETDEFIATLLSKTPNKRPIDCESVLRRLSKLSAEKMSVIPAGSFFRGCVSHDSLCRKEEKPASNIELSGFLIDQTPVTVSQFQMFLDTTQFEIPENWSRFNPPEKADHPVVYINYNDAISYAKWAGKRLPTEAEWEKSARSTDERIFPWGDEMPTLAHAHFNREPNTSPVGEHVLGKSPYKVEDLAGNVFEWVSDWYNKKAYTSALIRDPQGPNFGTKRVLKGGSFVHGAFALRISSRGRYRPEERRANHGFRCVWSINDFF